MTGAIATKPNPLAAVLVYGWPNSTDLPQASRFRSEDKAAAMAAAAELKFSVIELQSEAERALAAGVGEGVLKGSGRMIVGSVPREVYRRIEEFVRQGSGAQATSGSGQTVQSGSTSKEQIMDQTTPNAAPSSTSATGIGFRQSNCPLGGVARRVKSPDAVLE